MKTPVVYFFILFVVITCSPNRDTGRSEENTREFFKCYASHKDFDQFMSYYSEDVVMRDMINGDVITGKFALRNFFDWKNPALKRTDSLSLIVKEIIFSENQAVASGYFTPFRWKDSFFEAMQFTTILTFNDSGKIIEQVDWINYPASLVDYQNRKNSNSWIQYEFKK